MKLVFWYNSPGTYRCLIWLLTVSVLFSVKWLLIGTMDFKIKQKKLNQYVYSLRKWQQQVSNLIWVRPVSNDSMKSSNWTIPQINNVMFTCLHLKKNQMTILQCVTCFFKNFHLLPTKSYCPSPSFSPRDVTRVSPLSVSMRPLTLRAAAFDLDYEGQAFLTF